MTGTILALTLFAIAAEEPPTGADQKTRLVIDACAAVDEQTVRRVMELEIQGARSVPSSVNVECAGSALEIRVETVGSPHRAGARTIQPAPAGEDAPTAARQARSRELALAIAELVRRQDVDAAEPKPPVPPAATPPPPLPPPSAIAVASASKEKEEKEERKEESNTEARWQLGILSAFEYFSGGSSLAGCDVLLASRFGRWFMAELRLGGRIRGDESLPVGHLTVRAGTAALAVGIAAWTGGHRVGGALALRGQGYLVHFRADDAPDGRSQAALLGAFSVAAEPRLVIAVSRWFALEATAAMGFLPRGIEVRVQGAQELSISRLLISGNLGAVLTF